MRASIDLCPLPQKACPGGAIGVPVGQDCPPPDPSPPAPVICWNGSTAAATLDCPAGRTLCPGGIAMPLHGKCLQADPTRCAKGTVRVLGVCTPVARPGDPVPVGVPAARAPEPGQLRFDRNVVTAGDTLFAGGAGCKPGVEVVLTAGGELVGRTVSGPDGSFETVVRFASFRPGNREVTATCGPKLESDIEMVLVSADTSASAPSVLLPFFLVLAFMAVRYQMAARGRRRARSARR